jgi:hypothetical protein
MLHLSVWSTIEFSGTTFQTKKPRATLAGEPDAARGFMEQS